MTSSSSERISRRFYDAIGADALERRTRPEWDALIVDQVAALLPHRGRTLDLGCGYGRICLPLARRGFGVIGLDLSESLVSAARMEAEGAKSKVLLMVGSMMAIPFTNGVFGSVICLWSAFNELLTVEEQTLAIAEMHRVLEPGGWALLEGPLYEEATREDIGTGKRSGPGGRISHDVIEGRPNPHYRHDERSFSSLMAAQRVERYRCFERDWGGRRRLLLRFEKT